LSLTSYGTFADVPAEDLIPPEQAIYNMLYVYFSGTAEASLFGGSTGSDPGPLNYLQIYSDDVIYAGREP
jgi:hypothetical protein